MIIDITEAIEHETDKMASEKLWWAFVYDISRFAIMNNGIYVPVFEGHYNDLPELTPKDYDHDLYKYKAPQAILIDIGTFDDVYSTLPRGMYIEGKIDEATHVLAQGCPQCGEYKPYIKINNS